MESKLYRLEEMLETMEQSIANAKDVKNQQFNLSQLIKSSDKAEEFKEFTDGLDETTKTMVENIKKLEEKKDRLVTVIGKAKVDSVFESFLNDFMDVIGMFEND